RRLDHVDFDARIATFKGDAADHAHPFNTLIGADGAGSTLRGQMAPLVALNERSEWLDHGYKEVEIPPASDGGFRIEANALHIWPRGHYMCIALPNDERNFTVTLFMPHQGTYPSFAKVRTGEDAHEFFERDFPDLLPLIPELRED